MPYPRMKPTPRKQQQNDSRRNWVSFGARERQSCKVHCSLKSAGSQVQAHPMYAVQHAPQLWTSKKVPSTHLAALLAAGARHSQTPIVARLTAMQGLSSNELHGMFRYSKIVL